MSQRFRQQALDLIAQATQRKRLIVYPALLVELLGDHHAAALLMQILYWGDRTSDPEGWFYKSYAEWNNELGLSSYQVRRCLDGDPRSRSRRCTLRDLGVETKLKKAGQFGAPVRHYRVDRAVFVAVLVEYMEQQHGFAAGQGDDQQCAESMINNVEDQSLTESIIDPAHCAAASSDSETNYQEISSELTLMPMPTHHPDENQENELFQAFENRFQKPKAGERAALKAELQRLGAPLVTEVLTRCAQRGRSWQYVLRALANELPRAEQSREGEPVKYDLPDPQVVLQTWQAEHDDEEAEREAQAALPKSERVTLEVGGTPVSAIWKAAKDQLERQLERPTFETWLKDAFLVDYDRDAQILVVAVPQIYARDFCQNRLYRAIWRAVADISGMAGKSLQLRFLTRAEWLEQATTAAA
jgi:hypothetical protein